MISTTKDLPPPPTCNTQPQLLSSGSPAQAEGSWVCPPGREYLTSCEINPSQGALARKHSEATEVVPSLLYLAEPTNCARCLSRSHKRNGLYYYLQKFCSPHTHFTPKSCRFNTFPFVKWKFQFFPWVARISIQCLNPLFALQGRCGVADFFSDRICQRPHH